MGVPDFDGGWSSQPSIWRDACIRQAAFALSLAHVINEVKREPVCPLAVREIWAYWDSDWPSPRSFKLAVQWGRRPQVDFNNPDKPVSPEELWEMTAESKDFWGVCAQEMDEGMLGHPFPPLESLLSRAGRKLSLIYRDTRVEPLMQSQSRQHRLWRMRRETLRSSAGEVADLLRTIGAAVAYCALSMPSQRLTLGEIRKAREDGVALAEQSLINCALHAGEREAGFEYDFACREAGEVAVEMGNTVKSMAYLQGFFTALSESPQWCRVAGGGEQEVFFGMLCRIETKWGESLDAMQRARLS